MTFIHSLHAIQIAIRFCQILIVHFVVRIFGPVVKKDMCSCAWAGKDIGPTPNGIHLVQVPTDYSNDIIIFPFPDSQSDWGGDAFNASTLLWTSISCLPKPLQNIIVSFGGAIDR